MKRNPLVALFMLLGFLTLAMPPVLSQDDPGLGDSLGRLTASVERLATLLEQDLARSAAEGDTRRVEAAVAILGLRYRKIDRIEAEIQRLTREGTDAAEYLTVMEAEAERLESADANDGSSLSNEVREQLTMLERRLELDRERVARINNDKLLLQNDLAAEQRRLSDLEAILDAWLEGLK